MKKYIILTTCLIGILTSHTILAQRLEVNFNTNWKFLLQDEPEAFNVDWDDSNWVKLDVPHDWAFEKGVSKNGAQTDKGGYFDGGIAWYRKNFEVPTEWSKKRVLIEFEGVYMNSEVWINGQYLGKRPYGYISFRYELSKFLKPGKNTIAVRVDNSKEPSARWYHPCGIYAPVHLLVTNQQYIAPNGVYLTQAKVDSIHASIKIETTLETRTSSKKGVILETSLFSSKGELIKKERKKVKWESNQSLKIEQIIDLENPELWSPDSPYLYTVESKLIRKKRALDEVKTTLGIRTIKWETESGFWLNGKVTKLLGVCEHYEGGPVGGAWTKPLLKWKLSLLKEMGVNAIRTAHNPVPPMFYDLCDEMGFLVMDEVFDGWSRKAENDYGAQAFNEWWEKDVAEWITRDRNHPSIFVYSLGNETRGEVAKDLVDLCHKLDFTRKVTSGHSAPEFMDIYGINGASEKQSFYTNERPDKPIVATEAPHTWQTRGYYRTKTWYRDGFPNDRQQPFELPDLTDKEIFHYEWASPEKWTSKKQHFNSSYDNAMVRISARKNWELMRDLPWYSGHFRWTGFDYYGEAGYVHGGWPFRLFMGGALDVAGFEKDLFYFYQSQWTEKPMIHILPHWTHPSLEAGTKVPVWVYSNCDEVELFLNGKSLGKDKPGTKWDEMQCEWLVPWEPGTLEAKGYINGVETVQTRQITAGSPASLQLSLETNHINTVKDNIAIVTAAINDSKNVLYPYGENKVYYHFDGPVRILSLENGDPVDTTKNVGIDSKKAFMGLTRAFLQLDETTEPVSLITGAILGEKQLIHSNLVAIDAKTSAIRGEFSPAQLKIYYTIDESEPTINSKEYLNSFPVEPGTTVKAIIVRNGELILKMTEKFDSDLGLYWGTNELENADKNLKGMKAVDAEYSGARVESLDGLEYLNFNKKDGKVRWYQENDGAAGEFILSIMYATEEVQSYGPMELFINNRKAGVLEFDVTGSGKSNWKEVSTKQNLEAGANYIELRITQKSSLNILLLKVE
jgi:beta-galactosidase